jgi:hypothetical protein
MAMIVVVSLVQYIFVWNQTLMDKDRERIDESITIASIRIEGGQLSATLINTGEGIAHIVGLWVNKTRYDQSFYLNAGESKTEVGSNLTLIPQPNDESEQLITIVTKRGNAATKTYSLLSLETPPAWWEESSQPIVVLPENSSLDGNTLYLEVYNRYFETIDVDLIVCTRIVVGTSSSSKVQVVNVDWQVPSKEISNLEETLDNAVTNGDGLRVELVSSHNWVVGTYIFIYD